MAQLPYIQEVRLSSFSPDNFDELMESPYSFFLDSACKRGIEGRYSFFGINPIRLFSSIGGFVTIDGHTVIDNPVDSLRNFEMSAANLPDDPYLPFCGGLVGFVGHSWPGTSDGNLTDPCSLPDAWFGLYDTIVTFDHLEKSCWISSMGLSKDGSVDIDVAKQRTEDLLQKIETNELTKKDRYIIKPLLPDPVSNFNKDAYIWAIEAAKKTLDKKEWQRANLARRFFAPVATTAWSIHKMLRKKNPTPYASFMRCGNFELLSTSPSGFLQIKDNKLVCNVVQKSAPRMENIDKDRAVRAKLLHKSPAADPVMLGDKGSLKKIFSGKPLLQAAQLEYDARSHYLVNRIEGKIEKGWSNIDCLAAAMPGASMTGVPKTPVNNWLRKTEPAKRNVYTGAMGYIGTGQSAQFNTAVRTMIVKDSIAFVHSGWQIEHATDAEEAFYSSAAHINRLFEEIKELGY